MARNNRIFIAFAVEDQWARDYLVGQMRNARSPFAWTDMSVKEPWSSSWKTNCRTRIRGCDGLIALISRNTRSADGQLWEIGCAAEERVPRLGLYTTQDQRPAVLPAAIGSLTVRDWTWPNIEGFLARL